MFHNIYSQITRSITQNRKMLAVLLDPDKCCGSLLDNSLSQLNQSKPDFIFIGGSTKSCGTDKLIGALTSISVPKILFPGDVSQFSPTADAILFLSLLSGNNPDYMIGQHRRASIAIKESGIEVIPTAYLLIDGNNYSSVQRISETCPINHDNIALCMSTAVAGELLGMKLVYLEAGSGAKTPVSADMIQAVKEKLSIPLIVGGGIRSTKQMKIALDSGADILVVGNIFETETDKIAQFVQFIHDYNKENKIDIN